MPLQQNPQCTKCGGETQLREGVSKKNNKPWKGYKCSSCDNMDFVQTKRTQGTGELPTGHLEAIANILKQIELNTRPVSGAKGFPTGYGAEHKKIVDPLLDEADSKMEDLSDIEV